MKGITGMERILITELWNRHDGETHLINLCLDGIKDNQTSGVVSSLIKKGVIHQFQDELPEFSHLSILALSTYGLSIINKIVKIK